jgi:hypothetical protein
VLAVVGLDLELLTTDVLEMGSDRLRTLATTGNLDHHFRGMPDSARDLFVLSRQQPQLPFRGNSAPVAHNFQERTVTVRS